jgi:hypothetical protein
MRGICRYEIYASSVVFPLGYIDQRLAVVRACPPTIIRIDTKRRDDISSVKTRTLRTILSLLSLIGVILSVGGCEVRPFKDFDVASFTFDPNAFPLNPKWGKQFQSNQLPTPNQSCPIYSDDEDPAEWTSSPQYPNCTSYTVSFNGAVTCGAHVNFMPVCYEGRVVWGHHNQPFLDDEYYLNVFRDDDNALYSTISKACHIEFSSDETVDDWDDTGTWWSNFHNDIDHWYGGSDDDKAHAIIDGHFVIVIGQLGLDANHDGKTELHPVYAMFLRLPISDDPKQSQSKWAFFVRNWGTEGFCGANDVPLDTREQTVKVLIPDAVSLVSSNLWEGAQNEDNLSAMGASMQPTSSGVLVTFKLLVPDKQSWFVGDFTFQDGRRRHLSSVVATERSSPAGPSAGRNQNSDNEGDKSPLADLQAQINRLPEGSKRELYAQLRNVVPRSKAVHVQPTVIFEPAKLDETYHKQPVKVVVKPALVRPKEDSGGKLNRQKRIELAKKYLAEKGIE